MEDTVVINFLSNLTQLAISGHQVIAKERDELLCLHNKIEYMSKFLKMAEEKRSQDQQVRRLVMKMRDTVFKAENIIDLFVVDAITVGDGGETDLSVKLKGIKKDIEPIEDQVKTMTNSNAEMTPVGFEQEVNTINGQIEDGKDLQIQNMQSLILEDCPNLEMLPTGLAQLSQLSLIEVKHCNKHVERLARKIVQQHNKLFGEDKLKTVIISKS